MSNFEDLWNLSQPILDDHFGEVFTLEPRTRADPNGRAAVDPTRLAQDFIGIWTDPHAIVQPANRTGHPKTEGEGFGDDKPSVDFTSAALPYDIVIGDLVTRQATGLRYAVSDIGKDGFTRSSAKLTAARGRS